MARLSACLRTKASLSAPALAAPSPTPSADVAEAMACQGTTKRSILPVTETTLDGDDSEDDDEEGEKGEKDEADDDGAEEEDEKEEGVAAAAGPGRGEEKERPPDDGRGEEGGEDGTAAAPAVAPAAAAAAAYDGPLGLCCCCCGVLTAGTGEPIVSFVASAVDRLPTVLLLLPLPPPSFSSMSASRFIACLSNGWPVSSQNSLAAVSSGLASSRSRLPLMVFKTSEKEAAEPPPPPPCCFLCSLQSSSSSSPAAEKRTGTIPADR